MSALAEAASFHLRCGSCFSEKMEKLRQLEACGCLICLSCLIRHCWTSNAGCEQCGRKLSESDRLLGHATECTTNFSGKETGCVCDLCQISFGYECSIRLSCVHRICLPCISESNNGTAQPRIYSCLDSECLQKIRDDDALKLRTMSERIVKKCEKIIHQDDEYSLSDGEWQFENAVYTREPRLLTIKVRTTDSKPKSVTLKAYSNETVKSLMKKLKQETQNLDGVTWYGDHRTRVYWKIKHVTLPSYGHNEEPLKSCIPTPFNMEDQYKEDMARAIALSLGEESFVEGITSTRESKREEETRRAQERGKQSMNHAKPMKIKLDAVRKLPWNRNFILQPESESDEEEDTREEGKKEECVSEGKEEDGEWEYSELSVEIHGKKQIGDIGMGDGAELTLDTMRAIPQLINRFNAMSL